MKRIAMMIMLLMITLSVGAQNLKGFISTGQDVNVRKGPGMRYPVIDSEWGKIQLDKGEVVCDMGKSKNGFRQVSVTKLIFGSVVNEYEGWVSSKYLRPVKVCSECYGTGYVGEIEDMKSCEKCKEKGHL